MIAYVLRPSFFCEIWALCVSWITYDHLYYAPCFASWALFSLWVSAMCNRTSCAQVLEVPQSHCGDNWEGTLFSWLHTYYVHLASMRFEHSVCRGSLMTIYIYIHIIQDYFYFYFVAWWNNLNRDVFIPRQGFKHMFGQHHFCLQKISQSVSWLFKVLITLMSFFCYF